MERIRNHSIGPALLEASCEGGLSMNSNTTLMHSKELERISDALISGFISLVHQAKAVGLGRSTAWTIIKNKHKCGRLSVKTIKRILKNLDTPPRVRVIVEQYRSERFAGIRADRRTRANFRSGLVDQVRSVQAQGCDRYANWCRTST
jgi:hypothetical protein